MTRHSATSEFVSTLLKGVGALFLVASLLGWYLLFGSIIALMELPIPDFPVFDLSNVIKARKRGMPQHEKDS